jgi:hypothetical protein
VGGLIILDKLNDFKSAADKVMKDIKVSDELKEKTLMKCRKRNNRFFISVFIPAACLGVFLIVVYIGGFPFKAQPPGNEVSNSNTPNANIMSAQGNSTLPISQESEPVKPLRATVSVILKTLDEAKKYIDNDACIPSYLPSGFKLKGIQALSYNEDSKRSLFIEYVSGDKSFVISVEQESEWKSFEGYKDVQINELAGHIKTYNDSSYTGAEIRWFAGKALYTVEGAVPENEALKIARSLE